jgi:hypothetical protein
VPVIFMWTFRFVCSQSPERGNCTPRHAPTSEVTECKTANSLAWQSCQVSEASVLTKRRFVPVLFLCTVQNFLCCCSGRSALMYPARMWLLHKQFIGALPAIADRLCGLVVSVPGCYPRGPEFDSRRYQIFRVAVGLERGPLSPGADI